jgi:hypothetical protein
LLQQNSRWAGTPGWKSTHPFSNMQQTLDSPMLQCWKSKYLLNHPYQSYKPTSEDDRGDILLLRGFCSCGMDCIVDIRVTNKDAKSYLLPQGPSKSADYTRKGEKG